MEEKLNDQEQARRDKLPRYQELGVDPFGARYEWKDQIKDLRKQYASWTEEQFNENPVTVNVAGRLLAIRRMGKASFVNLQDEYGSIQAWIGLNVIGEHDYEVFRLADSPSLGRSRQDSSLCHQQAEGCPPLPLHCMC